MIADLRIDLRKRKQRAFLYRKYTRKLFNTFNTNVISYNVRLL